MAVLVLMAMLFIGLVPLPPVHAVSLTSINPTSGIVGTNVTLVGTIDVLGGDFEVFFDAVLVASGQAPANSDLVIVNFFVPAANGSDIGLSHLVTLRDVATANVDFANFLVITNRAVFGVPARIQEGDSTAVTMNVTGGISSITYDFDLNVTDPTGAFHLDTVSVTTDALGSGESSASYPGTFSSTPDTNFVGAYDIVADETAPGSIPDAATGSFTVGLTDAASYERFDPVDIASTGWAALENVTLDIQTAGASVTIGTVTYPTDLMADAGGSVFHTSDDLPVDIATGTYTVTVVNNTGAGTTKVPADDQDFEVTASTAIGVAQVTPPTAALERTEDATAVFEITYPNGDAFNVSRFSSVTVSVLNGSGVNVATVSLAAADFNAATLDNWNATWTIPKDASLDDHNLTVAVGQVVDIDGNIGPDPEAASSDFLVLAADLDVAISPDDEPAVDEEFNRTATVTLELRVSYPDGSVFAPADLGALAVNVTHVGVAFDIANLTLSASDFNAATGNWTAQWFIPFDAEVTNPGAFQYAFIVRAGGVSDPFGNDNTLSEVSNDFNVTAVTLVISVFGTDRATYEREETVFVFFRALYLDGSLVTTGSADITLTPPAGLPDTILAEFEPTRNRFEASFFLTVLDPVGTWTADIDISALDDTEGNLGPNVTLNVTFEVVRAVEVIQVEADAGSLHFPGEIAQFFVISADQGGLIDVTYDAVDVHTPDLLVVSLLATRTAVDIGISRFDYPIPTNAPVGTYSLVVRVSVVFAETVGRGVTLTSFRISAEMNGFVVNVSGDIATIQTDVGLIQADLAALNPVIIGISNGVATIQTDVGVLRADVSAINAIVTDIQGDMATVVTDVGTLRGQVTGIEDDVATIRTDVGDIQADISGVADLSPAVGNILTVLFIATALALIAAIAAIIAVVVIMRRLAV